MPASRHRPGSAAAQSPAAPHSASPPRVEVIASRENRWLKQFRAALAGGPIEQGWIGVEGPHLVGEALRAGLEIRALLVSASGEPLLPAALSAAGAAPPAARLLKVSDRLFASLSGTRSPQGIAALVRRPEAAMADLLGGLPLLVVLVGVQDPGNTGSVVRSAEAFGATGVITTQGSADPFSPKALRASAGSALRLPVVAGAGPAVVLAQLRMAGVRAYAADTRQGLSPEQAALRAPAALLIGGEGAGLPAEVVRSADDRIRIPLAAGVDSLNAAVAAAVLLYEAARQRAAL